MRKLPHLILFSVLFFFIKPNSHGQIPVITSLDKTSGSINEIVTILGSGFDENIENLDVFFGAVKGTINKSSDTLIQVTVPPGATYASISVINKVSRKIGYSSEQFLLSFSGSFLDSTKFELTSIQSSEQLFDLALCDFDGDGLSDVVVSKNTFPSSDLNIYHNTSNNNVISFNVLDKSTNPELDLKSTSYYVYCGDINADGKPDIVASADDNVIHILINESSLGNISFKNSIDFFLPFNSKKAIVNIRDLDADGLPDVVAVGLSSNEVYIFKNISNNSGFQLEASPIVLKVVGANGLVVLDVEDLNGDGLPEVVVASPPETIHILPNGSSPGSISFEASIQSIAFLGTLDLIIGDVTKDGKPDILRTENCCFKPGHIPAIDFMENKTNDNQIAFEAPYFYELWLPPHGITLADFDGDGGNDILLSSIQDPRLNILNCLECFEDFYGEVNQFPPGGRPFSSTIISIPAEKSYYVEGGDISGDGKPDIIYTGFENGFTFNVLRNTTCLSPKLNQETNLSICNEETIILSSVYGPEVNYLWQKDGIEVKSGTEPFIDVTAPGLYKVTANSENGACNLSDSVTVVLDPNSHFVDAGPDLIINESDIIQLNGSISGFADSAFWEGGSGADAFVNINSLKTTYTPTPEDLAKDSIVLVLTTYENNFCSPVSDFLIVSIVCSQPPTADAGSDIVIFGGDTILLKGIIGGSAILATWSGGSNVAFSDINSSITTYVPTEQDLTNDSLVFVLTAKVGTCEASDSINVIFTDITPPTDIILNNNTIPEKRMVGTPIGNLETVDKSKNENHTYELVDGIGSTNNNLFSINNGFLVSNEIFDLSIQDTLSVRIKTTDKDSLSFEKSFSIIIIPETLNGKPLKILLSNNQIFSDAAVSATVGILSTIDQDNDDTHTYSIKTINGEPSNINDPFVINIFLLLVGSLLDPNVTQYKLLMESKDQGGLTIEEELIIFVQDPNIPPTDIVLSDQFILENMPPGSFVGTFTAFDNDLEDTHSFTLVSGNGSTNNNDFIIKVDTLKTNNSFVINDIEDIIKNIRVRVTDNFDGIFEKEFTINVIDNTAPTFSSLSFPQEFLIGTSSVQISIAAQDNLAVHIVSFNFKGIAQEDLLFQSIDINSESETFKINIIESMMDNLGLEFFITISDEARNMTKTENKFIYKRFETVNVPALPNFNISGTLESYKIISIPYQMEDPSISTIFEQKLGSWDKSKWRILHYNSLTEKYLEYPNDLKQIDLGKGYWFNTKVNTGLIEIGISNTPKYNQTNPFVLNLEQGWNQIGNPFDLVLDWNEVVLENNNSNLNPELIIYDNEEGIGYLEEEFLLPYQGGWIYSNDKTTIDVSVLNTIQTGEINELSKQISEQTNRTINSNLNSTNWHLKLELNGNLHKNKISGLGMHENGSDGLDQFDGFNPPRFLNYLEIVFDPMGNNFYNLRKSIVPSQADYTWEFKIEKNTEDDYLTLSWNNLEFGDNEKTLILFDEDEQRLVDLRISNTYKFKADGGNIFKMYYGVRENILDNVKPTKIHLGSNYPNPLNNSTTIPFTLPPFANEFNVSLLISTLDGRILRTLFNRNLSPGFHEINWNKINHKGELTSGIYIYTLYVNWNHGQQKLSKRLIIK